MAYATQDDVAVRLGRAVSTTERDMTAVLLDDAERMLVHGIPGLLGYADADTDYQRRVVIVESSMVTRVLKNPGGYRTTAEGGSYSQVEQRAASGYLQVFRDEWELLGAPGDADVFTVAPVFTEPAWTGGVW